MSSCLIFKVKDQIKIHSQSKTFEGLQVASTPVFLLKKPQDIEFWNAVLECIEHSHEILHFSPKDEIWKIKQEDILSKLKEKSFSNLYKKSASAACSVELSDNNEIHIKKYEYSQVNRGLIEDEDNYFNNEFDKSKALEYISTVKRFLNF